MDERGHLALILIIFFLLLLFVFRWADTRQQALQDELQQERRYTETILQEYSQLVMVNEHMRQRVLDLNVNLSQRSAELARERGENVSAPSHRIPLSQVQFGQDSVVINIDDVVPGLIAPTGSMEPVLTADTIVLEVTPETPAEILPGDIVIYELDDSRIIHRVVRIGWDRHGWFAITKGDSNPAEDPHKVRFDQVRGILVGIIY